MAVGRAGGGGMPVLHPNSTRKKKIFVNSYFFACIYVRIILKCAHEHDIYRISEVHDMQEG